MTRLRVVFVLLCLLPVVGAVDGADARKRPRLTVSKQRHKRATHVPRAVLLAPLWPAAPGAPAPSPQGVPQPASQGAPGEQPAAGPEPMAITALGVEQREFSTLLSRETLNAGDVLVQLRNEGEDPHDLQVVPLDGQGGGGAFAAVGPGAMANKTLGLGAGRYYLFCSLVDSVSHEQAGMRATLTVTAPA